MRAVFDKGVLLVLLRDFYELPGLRTVVFDEWGMDILSYPQQLPDYCRLVRATPQGEMGCRLCDQKACRQARQEKTTWIYPCHAGLIEAITPIQIDGVVVVKISDDYKVDKEFAPLIDLGELFQLIMDDINDS